MSRTIQVKKYEVMEAVTCFQLKKCEKTQYLTLLNSYTIEPHFAIKSGKEWSATVIFFSGKALTWGAAAFGDEIPDDIVENYEKKAKKLYKSFRYDSVKIRKLFNEMLMEAIKRRSYRQVQAYKTT